MYVSLKVLSNPSFSTSCRESPPSAWSSFLLLGALLSLFLFRPPLSSDEFGEPWRSSNKTGRGWAPSSLPCFASWFVKFHNVLDTLSFFIFVLLHCPTSFSGEPPMFDDGKIHRSFKWARWVSPLWFLFFFSFFLFWLTFSKKKETTFWRINCCC